ncbi:MAG: bifunctional 5,10-methylenetetrahydrofolate dehydrogenase/5,10-methenyltetrahydrofolate cyclohydrolase [Candidatus Baltobacteraceae bacterium]
MPARILDGRALARELLDGLAARAASLRTRGVAPRLVVALVGEDPASEAYVRSIASVGRRAGVEIAVDVLDSDATDAEVRTRLEGYGAEARVHGVILQQPLPAGRSIRRIADAMPVDKDVDGANPTNQGLLAFGSGARFVPATPAAVMLLLERSDKWPLRGRDVTVIGRSSVVGLPVSLLLMAEHATVTVTHKETRNLPAHVRAAEVVVVAAGRPGLVTGDWLRPGATIIDVGTTVVEGKLVGDVEFASVNGVAGELTPVPGGVGPVTNVALMRNVILAAERLAARNAGVDG